MHWANKYVGLKYVAGGRTASEGLDCWGLVHHVYKHEYGIQLPTYPGIAEESLGVIVTHIQTEIKDNWIEVLTPIDGCAIGMSQGSVLHHVGLYAETPWMDVIIHNWRIQGVICDTFRRLRFKGFKTFKFYVHKLWPTLSKSPTRLNHSNPVLSAK